MTTGAADQCVKLVREKIHQCSELLAKMAERKERQTGKGGDRKSQSRGATVIPPKLSSLAKTWGTQKT
jgi:hypothetical protein